MYWSLLSCMEPYLVKTGEMLKAPNLHLVLTKQAWTPFQPASDRSNTHGAGAVCDDDGGMCSPL